MKRLEFHQLVLKHRELRIASPVAQKRLVASLAEQGQVMPISVVPIKGTVEIEQYVLIDGYRRVEALQTLCRDSAEALVMSMSESEALVWHHQCRNGRARSPLEEAWLLRELYEIHNWSLATLGRSFGRTKSWVSRRLAMVEVLPAEVQKLVRHGVVCAYAAQKYLVPLARANEAHCLQLATGLAGECVNARGIEQLYLAWKGASAVQKERIVQNPQLFLSAQAERNGSGGSKRDRQPGPKVYQSTPRTLDDELALMIDELDRHGRQVLERLTSRNSESALPILVKRAWSRASLCLETLLQTVEGRCNAE